MSANFCSKMTGGLVAIIPAVVLRGEILTSASTILVECIPTRFIDVRSTSPVVSTAVIEASNKIESVVFQNLIAPGSSFLGALVETLLEEAEPTEIKPSDTPNEIKQKLKRSELYLLAGCCASGAFALAATGSVMAGMQAAAIYGSYKVVNNLFKVVYQSIQSLAC